MTGRGSGAGVVLLHGWPGNRTDYRDVTPLLSDSAVVVVPDLRGFGLSDKREFWYQSFHQRSLVEEIIDGRSSAVRAYLRHFWCHWSGPSFTQPDRELDRLTEIYGEPGAFTASIAWYRAGSGMVATSMRELATPPPERISVPTTVLWPEHDPLFPPARGDRLAEYFTDVTVKPPSGVGHFVPREAPRQFAEEIHSALQAREGQ